CAAAGAVIRTIRDERLVERSARLGDAILERARSWPALNPRLSDVRGLGLMIGLEFTSDGGAPDPGTVAGVRAAALEAGLLLLSRGGDDSVVRVIPPLTIPETELDQGLDSPHATRAALASWRATPWPARGEIILRAGLLLEERKEEMARLMTREMGKVLVEARGDVQEGVDMAKYIAGEARRPFGQTVPSELRDKWA